LLIKHFEFFILITILGILIKLGGELMFDSKFKTFYKLIETKNMTKTAKILNMTQPGVSKQIRQLEEKLGVELVEKRGRNIIITQAGIVLGDEINKMILLENQICKKMQDMNSKVKTYRIGATKTIGAYIVSDLLKNYVDEYKCHFILSVDNTDAILKKLDENMLDLALVEGIVDLKQYETKVFMEDELIYIRANNDKYPDKCKLKDIFDDILITREKGSGTRNIIERAFLEINIELDNFVDYMEVGDITAIKSLVKKNMGSSFISQLAVKEEIISGDLKHQEISDFHIKRDLYYVWNDTGNIKFVNKFINHNEKLLNHNKV